MDEEIQKKRGRPKNVELRNRILDTARELFFQIGFQATSMDAIAQKADVSNRTVYSHFLSKEALLWAVMEREGEAFRPRVSTHPPKSQRELRQQLCDFGNQFIRLLTTPNIVAMGRVLISECTRHPNMADQFYRWGPEQTQRYLAAVIENGQSQRWLEKTDPLVAAHHLLALWQGGWHLRQQLGLQRPLNSRQIADHANECVDFFMKALQK